MSTAFSNALAGLNASTTAINVISSNLANLNTTGYKNTTVSFQDLISENLGGGDVAGSNEIASGAGGSTVAQTSTSFTQGAVQATGQPYDAGIQGNGFFVVKTANGAEEFTRAGNFKVDATGNLVTQGGQFVQGWNAVNGTLSTNGAVQNLQVPAGGLLAPVATTNLSVSANLSSNAAVGSAAATFSTPVPVTDSLGNTHNLTITYTKSAANTWDYTVTVPAADLASPSGTGANSTVASGTLTFDSSGNLLTPASGSGPIPLSISGLGNGAADLNVNWNLYPGGNAGITQYDQASANLGSTEDGNASGQFSGVSIGTNGQLVASYSNGTTITVGQIALASILNPDSMQDVGDNNYGLTAASALPAIGAPGTGSLGSITGGALESSTVDIAQEFTNLLTYERGYQANSKVITTEDTIVQSTIALING